MTTALYTPAANAATGLARPARRLSRRLAQALLLSVALAAGAAGFLVTDAGAAAKAAANAGEDLTRLLRAMAAIKTAMALAVVGAVVWRLSTPVSAARLTLYALACASMAAGPGLIWSMVYLGWGAILLHAGLAAGALMLWRDPEVTRRLSAAISARRRRNPL